MEKILQAERERRGGEEVVVNRKVVEETEGDEVVGMMRGKDLKEVKTKDRKAQHRQELDAYLSTLMADEDKCREFMRQIEKLKSKKRTERAEEREE
jgi:hypothetical protein